MAIDRAFIVKNDWWHSKQAVTELHKKCVRVTFMCLYAWLRKQARECPHVLEQNVPYCTTCFCSSHFHGDSAASRMSICNFTCTWGNYKLYIVYAYRVRCYKWHVLTCIIYNLSEEFPFRYRCRGIIARATNSSQNGPLYHNVNWSEDSNLNEVFMRGKITPNRATFLHEWENNRHERTRLRSRQISPARPYRYLIPAWLTLLRILQMPHLYAKQLIYCLNYIRLLQLLILLYWLSYRITHEKNTMNQVVLIGCTS